MFNFFTEIMAILAAFMGLIVKSEDAGGTSVEKKVRAVEELFAVLESPEGLNWPGFLKNASVSTKKGLLGVLCDVAVFLGNKMGLSQLSKT